MVHFVSEHDAPDHVERAARLIVNERLVVSSNIGRSDIVSPDEPVKRVILPSCPAQRMCNIANAILCHT